MSLESARTFTGTVREGDKVGRQIGFPTANISFDGSVLPGIYCGAVSLYGTAYMAALFISKARPAVLEAHILDFEGDLYGTTISVRIMDRIRDEIEDLPGYSLETLKSAIAGDVTRVRKIFATLKI